LREEVIRGWSSLKEKINQVKFSPQDKKVIEYLDKCGLSYFYSNLVKNEDLDWQEKKFEAVRDKLSNLDVKNEEILSDYWNLACTFTHLILDWIKLKKDYKNYITWYWQLKEKYEPEVD